MHQYFEDIINRLGEPEWYDMHGFPRYDPFHPGETCNIYADLAMLLEIACQECHMPFRVAMHWSAMDFYSYGKKSIVRNHMNFVERMSIKKGVQFNISDMYAEFLELFDKEQLRSLVHYGDPPRHPRTECLAGETMNCYDLRIVECWRRPMLGDWIRMPEFEIELQKIDEYES